MSETKTRKSTSIEHVKIPDGPWCTLLEGAAYVRMGYSRFVEAANRREFPVHLVPGTESRKQPSRRVKKPDLDQWLEHGPSKTRKR